MNLFKYLPKLSRLTVFLLVGLNCIPKGNTQIVQPPDPSAPIVNNNQIPASPLPQNSNQYSFQPQSNPAQPALSEMLGEADLAPNKSIKRLPPLWPIYLTLTIVGLIIFLIAIIWIVFRKKKTKPIPIIPADILALNALEKLKPLVEQAKAREFAYQASEIIRGYIEDRYGVKARNCTTREFLNESLENTHTLPEKHQSTLRNFLNYCDLAKYARQILSPDQLSEMFLSASGFVMDTRPSIIAYQKDTEVRKEQATK